MKKTNLFVLLILIFQTSYSQPAIGIVPFTTGINDGISTIANANDSRLFVAVQLGYVYILTPTGTKLARPFLDIYSKVTPTSTANLGEKGLLGIAFSPHYATDGTFYINYTNKLGQGNSVIARYHVSSDPDSADVASEEILLTIYQPFGNHKGGCLQFGNDGYLYCALGDGGSAGDPYNVAQNTDSLLGKILRLDVSGTTGYTIPPTNPFVAGGGAPQIWAYGLRNPWKFSFDRVTHDLWIGDVGQADYEEVNRQLASSPGGENYGWHCYEATHPYDTVSCGPLSSYVAPVYEYPHSGTATCAVTGGYVYRGTAYPALYGYYIFADYCPRGIYSLSIPGYSFGTTGNMANNFVAFGENAAGELFVGDQYTGTIFRIVDANTLSAKAPDKNIQNFAVFPNPNRGNFSCDVNLNTAAEAEIFVLDMMGSVCYSEHTFLNTGSNQIDLFPNVTDGIYFVKIKTNAQSVYSKVMVSR